MIGSFRAGRHRTMMPANHHDPSITFPNLLPLAAGAAMPFFTAFASANPVSRVPAFCYCAWMLVAALLNRRLQGLLTRPAVVDPAVTPARIAEVRARGTAVILGAATACLVSLVLPILGQAALTSIPLWHHLPDRRWRRPIVASGPSPRKA